MSLDEEARDADLMLTRAGDRARMTALKAIASRRMERRVKRALLTEDLPHDLINHIAADADG